MDVARAGRGVEDEVVECAPVGITYQLLQCIARHAAPPQCSRAGVNKEPDGEQLDAILLNRYNEVASLHALGIGAGIFYMEHLGHRGTEDVGVEQSYAMSQFGQCDSQVGCYGALAHTALAARYSHYVLDLRQQLAYLGAWCLPALGGDGYFCVG